MQKVQLLKINVAVPRKKLVASFDCTARVHENLMHLCNTYEHRSLFSQALCIHRLQYKIHAEDGPFYHVIHATDVFLHHTQHIVQISPCCFK